MTVTAPAPFSTATYEARIARVLQALDDAGVDAGLLTRNGTLAYLSGVFLPWRSALVLRRDRDPVLITQDIDVGRVRAETWLPEVRAWSGRPSFVELAVDVLGGVDRATVGVELSGPVAQGLLLANELRRLESALPSTSWGDVAASVDGVLVRKEPGEVACLEQASRLAQRGVLAAVDALAPGITELELAGIMELEARRGGSEWAWSTTGGSEVASGPRTAYPGCVCTPPTSRQVRSGEFVTLDAHAMFERYQGELCTNAFLGELTAQQRGLADTFEQMVAATVNALRPGATIADACRPALAIAEAAGLTEHVVPLFGHGLGTDARIPPIVAPWNRRTLDEATTLVVLVQITHPRLGGLRAEYPVVIEADGARPLVDIGWELQRRG